MKDYNKLAQNKPSDEDVKAALKVLNDAGISPYNTNPVTGEIDNPDMQTQTPQSVNYQNPQLME